MTRINKACLAWPDTRRNGASGRVAATSASSRVARRPTRRPQRSQLHLTKSTSQWQNAVQINLHARTSKPVCMRVGKCNKSGVHGKQESETRTNQFERVGSLAARSKTLSNNKASQTGSARQNKELKRTSCKPSPQSAKHTWGGNRSCGRHNDRIVQIFCKESQNEASWQTTKIITKTKCLSRSLHQNRIS